MTLGTMKTRLATDLSRDDIASDAVDAINRAIIHYEKEPFWFKETSASFTLSASQKIYTSSNSNLPSNIKEIHYVELQLSGGDEELKEEDISWIERNNPNNSTGEPTAYGWWNNSMYFYLIPSANRVVNLFYTKSYAELSGDSDTNDWLTYAEDLIEARARWWLCKRKLKMYAAAQEAKAEEIEALQALREKNEDLCSNLRIKPTGF